MTIAAKCICGKSNYCIGGDGCTINDQANAYMELLAENAKLKEALEKWKEDCASNVKYSLELKEALEKEKIKNSELEKKWQEKYKQGYADARHDSGQHENNELRKQLSIAEAAKEKAEREKDEFAVNICSWLYELDEDGDHNYESYKMISESVRYDLMVKDFKQSQLKDNGTKKEG